jgi:hypothetical protein
MTAGDHDPRAVARRWRLGAAAAATLAATVWAALQTDDTPTVEPPAAPSPRARAAEPAPREADRGTRVATAPRPSLVWPDAPHSDRSRWQDISAQGEAAWGPPPPPPPPPAPPPMSPAQAASAAELRAPPFPYTLIGRIDDGVPRALLSGPLRSFGVKAADVIDGQWRVDAVQPRGVTLTWLPGQTKKTLAFSPS